MIGYLFQALLLLAVIYGCHAFWKHICTPTILTQNIVSGEQLKRLHETLDELKNTPPDQQPSDDNISLSQMEKDLEHFMKQDLHLS